MIFRLYAYRFHFRAVEPLFFPAGKAGNVFRGAFGMAFRRTACAADCTDPTTCLKRSTCSYARMFEPALAAGPSGFAHPPRPFVFRAAHLDGRTIAPGEPFSLDVHVFDLRDPALGSFTRAFSELANDGLGPRCARLHFEGVECLDATGAPAPETASPLCISLDPITTGMSTIVVRFVTPTELKAEGEIARPDFCVLFARARDRVSTLRSLYGGGPLDIDFRGMADRSRSVQLVRADLRHTDVLRRSSRTGEVHPIGGILGEVEYQGDLREFVPFLRAAYWTGVGRHTVWGNGAIVTTTA